MSDYFETDDVVKEYDSTLARRLVGYALSYKKMALLALASLVIGTLGEILVPVITKTIVDTILVTPNTGDINSAALLWASSALHRAVFGLGLVLLAVFASSFAQTWSTSRIAQGVMADIRQDLFRITLGQSTAFLSRHPVGRIVTRLTGDVETVNSFFADVLSSFAKDAALMAGTLITIYALSPKLGLATLITVPPVALATAVSRTRARDSFRRQRAANSAVNAYLSEHLSGITVVQLFGQENRSEAEFDSCNSELLGANLGEVMVHATFRPVVDFLANTTMALVILLAAYFAGRDAVTVGTIIAFVSLVQMFFAPVQDIAEKYTLLQSAMAGAERVFRLMDSDEVIQDKGVNPVFGNSPKSTGAVSVGESSSFSPYNAPPNVRGHIIFDRVHFSYIPGEEILSDLSFEVKPGELAAIVGHTGAGKTTIINLLTRLWDIDQGAITLDGVNIRDVPLSDLRHAVLPVLQEVFLFSGTVSDNIRLGLGLSDEEVRAAAIAVHAHDFITRLPSGYDTVLSEGATNISSGQRQLISFARVVAHNPAIVVLDEATSSVDTETEKLIQQGMAKMLAGRTSIVIAHRLSTIKNADRILEIGKKF